METQNIVKLNLIDLNEVMGLIKVAISEMESSGIFQWDELYPDDKTITGDILSAAMFGIFKDLELAAIVVLDKNQSLEYSNIQWQSDKGNPLVMHRLCVHPKFQGQGMAKQLLKFSEQFAADNKYTSIRLDAYSGNPRALKMYENNGYQKKGIVTFRKGDFYCYEKTL